MREPNEASNKRRLRVCPLVSGYSELDLAVEQVSERAGSRKSTSPSLASSHATGPTP